MIRRWFSLFAGAFLLGGPVLVLAAEEADGWVSRSFSVRGFGTFGLARSNTDQAQFVRDLSQPGGLTKTWSAKPDSVLGLQANWQAHEKVEAVAQVVSRYHASWDFNPELTWAFIKFDPDEQLSVRAGRIGTEFFMLADSRLVGYSFLSIRPPNDYYGGLPFSYIDGADATAMLPIGDGQLRGKLFAGVTREKVPLSYDRWDINQSRMSGGHLDYQTGAWQWRLGYAQIRFKHELPGPIATLHNTLNGLGAAAATAASNALKIAGKRSGYYSAGVVYDSGPLQVQLMLNKIRQQSAIFENSRAGYFIAGYRFGEFTPFLGYSQVKSAAKQLATGLGAAVDGPISTAMADSHSQQHTSFAGVRWDFRRDMALKLQADAIRGAPSSIFPYRFETSRWNGRMNVLGVSLDFVF